MANFDARDLKFQFDKKELKALSKTKPYLHAFAILFDWTMIVAAIYLCLQFFNPATYLLAIIIIGARMHALAILMHDATHFRFLKNRKWNDLLTNCTSMYFIFFSIEQYRQNHLAHHSHLNTEEDPDWFSKIGVEEFQFPKTKRAFLMTLFSYLILYKGIRDALWFLKRFGATKKKKSPDKKTNWVKPLFYLLLFGTITVLGIWKYFLLFWIVPYFSTFFMFQYIRSVAEHFGDLAYDHLLTSTRSVKTNWIERFFFAPHNVGYHLEHHLYPGVPFYNLPKLHQLLMKEENYNSKAHLTQGYMTGLLNELS